MFIQYTIIPDPTMRYAPSRVRSGVVACLKKYPTFIRHQLSECLWMIPTNTWENE